MKKLFLIYSAIFATGTADFTFFSLVAIPNSITFG